LERHRQHVDATIRLFAPDLEIATIPAKVIRRSDALVHEYT
jgi:hypothetical protein